MENDNSGILKIRSILVIFHTRKILAESSDYFNITLLNKPNPHGGSWSRFLHQSPRKLTTNDRKEAPPVTATSKPAQLSAALSSFFIPLPLPFPHSLSVWIRTTGHDKDWSAKVLYSLLWKKDFHMGEVILQNFLLGYFISMRKTFQLNPPKG